MAKRSVFGSALLLSLATTLLATPARSHTGDENSLGCHTDRRTGEYHCHEPKTPPPEVALTYCHVVAGQWPRCGHDRGSCYQLVLQFGGICAQQVGFSVR
jgi:hypothetical protein